MSKKQPIYTPEFRQQMVELIKAGRKPAELAREFGCHVSSLHNWVAVARNPVPVAGALSPDRQAEQAELARLRKENRQLKIERDILSKATAWFAHHGAPTPPSSTH